MNKPPDTGSDWTTKPPKEWVFAPKAKITPATLAACRRYSDQLTAIAAAARGRLAAIDAEFPEPVDDMM